MKEIWKDVKDYQKLYKVSNLGRVVNCQTKKMLKPTDNGTGYEYLSLYKERTRKGHLVHRMVAKAFLPKEKKYVNHKDGNKKNNKLNNLEWCTPSENANHALQNKLTPLGKQLPHTKLSDTQVRSIRRLYAKNVGNKYSNKKLYSLSKLSKRYGVSFQHISDIVNGKKRGRVL